MLKIVKLHIKYTCMHTTIIVIYNHTCTCTWNAIVHVHIGLKTKYMYTGNHLIINEISIIHKGYMWPGMRKSFTWETLISSNTFL